MYGLGSIVKAPAVVTVVTKGPRQYHTTTPSTYHAWIEEQFMISSKISTCAGVYTSVTLTVMTGVKWVHTGFSS